MTFIVENSLIKRALHVNWSPPTNIAFPLAKSVTLGFNVCTSGSADRKICLVFLRSVSFLLFSLTIRIWIRPVPVHECRGLSALPCDASALDAVGRGLS